MDETIDGMTYRDIFSHEKSHDNKKIALHIKTTALHPLISLLQYDNTSSIDPDLIKTICIL